METNYSFVPRIENALSFIKAWLLFAIDNPFIPRLQAPWGMLLSLSLYCYILSTRHRLQHMENIPYILLKEWGQTILEFYSNIPLFALPGN